MLYYFFNIIFRILDFDNYHWMWELDAKKEIQRQSMMRKVNIIKNNNKLRRSINAINNREGTEI
jgi:hypothetical protein